VSTHPPRLFRNIVAFCTFATCVLGATDPQITARASLEAREVFDRAIQGCVKGTKSAGNKCSKYNNHSQACGPGADANVVCGRQALSPRSGKLVLSDFESAAVVLYTTRHRLLRTLTSCDLNPRALTLIVNSGTLRFDVIMVARLVAASPAL
jgi:hypothetical protein